MAHDTLYLLVAILRDHEAIMDIFLYRDGKLFDLVFDRRIEPSLKKWNMKIAECLCEIANPGNIKDELFDKCPRYASMKETRNRYRMDRLDTVPGHYFPRVFRPQLIINHGMFIVNENGIEELEDEVRQVKSYVPFDLQTLVGGITQLSLLTEELKVVCRTVAPNHKNFQIFGHELRNLLILACTEVEAQLRGIYEANHKQQKNLNMQKYFELNKYLKLTDYVVLFNVYPWLDNFSPFKWWSAAAYKKLPWYTAYNEVKHDRENKFDQANLENVLNAIAALAILLRAQYGERPSFWKDLIGQFFKFCTTPSWDLEDYYLPPFDYSNWVEKKLLFAKKKRP